MQGQAKGIVGYADRWSVRAGDEIRFHVSARTAGFDAQLVRFVHGDDAAGGPGMVEVPIESALDGSHAGKVQRIAAGSCMLVDDVPMAKTFAFGCWIWPTRLGAGRQAVLAFGAGPDRIALMIDASGDLFVEAGAPGKEVMRLSAAVAERCWAFVILAVDAATIALHILPDRRDVLAVPASVGAARPGAATGGRLLLAAGELDRVGRSVRPVESFNGKLCSPALIQGVPDAPALSAWRDGTMPMHAIVAAWDFAAEANSERVPDRSGNGHHGRTINRPTRLVTGQAFRDTDRQVPDSHNAAHFHDDDLSDADWEPSIRFTVPPSLRSGVYAAKLSAGGEVDYVPFAVRPHAGQAPAAVALLLPTVSYVCYSNSDLDPAVLPPDLTPLADIESCHAERAYIRKHGLRSLYGLHSDGSGVCMSTMLRPMPINARPDSRSMLNGAAHQLAADLYITHFLEHEGIAYDVITDHDLHREGRAALDPYAVVLSGTHAEYWTGPMLDGLADYQEAGGRFVYLSGNGLYWVTGLSDDGTLVEIRRTHGTRSWDAPPGEERISLTGEQGGLWRHRGRAPQRYVGVGFSAQGFDRGCAYRRSPAADDPRARFIFDGVADEVIGDFPVLVGAYGAAGYEVDRADTALGTPAHALIVASATELNDSFQNALEDTLGMTPFHGGTMCDRVRADMVFYETPNGGAVFSVGSIAWCSGLSHNGYDNNVARITANVVRAFAVRGALPGSSA